MVFNFTADKESLKPLTLPINYDSAGNIKRKKAREQYVKEQKGKCWYCSNQLDGDPTKPVMTSSINHSLFPKGFFNNPVHLHHNHKTGMTIGAVHARCNAYLWQYHGE